MYSSWGTGYIKDKVGTAASDYTYAMSTSHDSGSPVTEGQEATFTITRTLGTGKTASAQTVYVSTKEGTAGLEDYQSLDKLAVDFKADELTKTVVVKTESDSSSILIASKYPKLSR